MVTARGKTDKIIFLACCAAKTKGLSGSSGVNSKARYSLSAAGEGCKVPVEPLGRQF